MPIAQSKPKLIVYYRMWGPVEAGRLYALDDGNRHLFKRLDEARSFAAFNGFSGIVVKYV